MNYEMQDIDEGGQEDKVIMLAGVGLALKQHLQQRKWRGLLRERNRQTSTTYKKC